MFRTAAYGRNAFAPHAALHLTRPMTAADFGRWVQLWRATVDGLHRGPYAERATSNSARRPDATGPDLRFRSPAKNIRRNLRMTDEFSATARSTSRTQHTARSTQHAAPRETRAPCPPP